MADPKWNGEMHHPIYWSKFFYETEELHTEKVYRQKKYFIAS